MTETAEMQAKPVAWRWRYDQRFAWHIGILELSDGIRNIAEVEPLYSQSDFDAMRAQRDEWEAAAIQARDGCNQRSDTIRSLRDKLAAIQAQITRLREALKHAVEVAEEAREEWDAAPSGMRAGKLLIALGGNLPGYRSDIDAIHATLSQSSPSNSGDTP